MRSRAGSAAAMIEMLTRLAGRLPSQTRRSEESEQLQQFSTPIALGFAAAESAMLSHGRFVAGSGRVLFGPRIHAGYHGMIWSSKAVNNLRP
jgi:hypothetical protein